MRRKPKSGRSESRRNLLRKICLNKKANPATPLEFVLVLNRDRRHLTTSQRAMAAARARELFEAEAKERQKAAGGNHAEKALVENLPQAPSERSRDAAGKASEREVFDSNT